MKISKMPSGSYRTVVAVGRDATGKRIVKTFTAKNKTELRLKVDEALEKYKNTKSFSDTFGNVAVSYMDAMKPVVSPNTHREYHSRYGTLSSVVPWFMDKKVYDIRTDDVQKVINTLLSPHTVTMRKGRAKEAKEYEMKGCSPKTAKNYCGYISGVLRNCGIVLPPIKLPEKVAADIYVPTDAEMKKVLAKAEGELSICVRLASFCLLREGEVCTLLISDFNGNVCHVCKDVGYPKGGGMIVKPTPKTYCSNRYIECPASLVSDIMEQGYVTHYTPKTLRKKFKKLLVESGVPDFRFHDLRHYGVSTLHAQGIPDAYIMKRGGWSTPSTLQKVYRHVLADQDKKLTQKANKHFDKMFSGEKP